MIELSLTRADMLEDIGASETELVTSLRATDDPVFLGRAPARLVLRAHHRADFLPDLERALRLRFARVASEHLEQDLFSPLKNALGNAFRRGNGEDRGKWLTTEIVVTPLGAVVSVADEGAGFDVQRVLSLFESGERYFSRGGHGLRCFARTSSLISYADGGRTWLMRFLSEPEPGKDLARAERAELGPAGDEHFMRDFFAGQVPCFRDHRIQIEACRIQALSHAHATSELAYVLHCRSRDLLPGTMVVTGRVLPEAAARADVDMAERLRRSGVGLGRGLRIPRPLGAFARPPLSLFHLDPSATFRERAKDMSRLGSLGPVLSEIALGLAAIHQSGARPALEETLADILDRQRAARRRVEGRLAGSDRERAGACFDRLSARANDLAPCEAVTVHGALDWDCIVRARERWELYRFEHSRRSHPGLDVGAFLADLLRFHVLRRKEDPRLYALGRSVFLQSYCAGPRPAWAADVDWFVAGALLERLERMLLRPPAEWAPKVGPLLGQIERQFSA